MSRQFIGEAHVNTRDRGCDWGARRCGLGPLLEPGDDVDADLERIKAFYAPFRGRNVEQFDTD